MLVAVDSCCWLIFFIHTGGCLEENLTQWDFTTAYRQDDYRGAHKELNSNLPDVLIYWYRPRTKLGPLPLHLATGHEIFNPKSKRG